MGKVIKVTNGTDTFDVNEDKLSLAVKDGFRPTERVIVANSKTGETYEVNPDKFNLALQDGFTFQDVVKKKVSGSEPKFGGIVGTSVSQSGKSKYNLSLAPPTVENTYNKPFGIDISDKKEPVQPKEEKTLQEKIGGLGLKVTFDKQPLVIEQKPLDASKGVTEGILAQTPATFVDIDNPDELSAFTSMVENTKPSVRNRNTGGFNFLDEKKKDREDVLSAISMKAAENTARKIISGKQSQNGVPSITRADAFAAGVEQLRQSDPSYYKRVKMILDSGKDVGDEAKYNIEKLGGNVLKNFAPDEYKESAIATYNETDAAHPEYALAKALDIVGAYNHQRDNVSTGGAWRTRPTLALTEKWLQSPELLDMFVGEEEALRQLKIHLAKNKNKLSELGVDVNAVRLDVPIGGGLNSFTKEVLSQFENIGNIGRTDVERQKSNINPTIGTGTLTGKYQSPGSSPSFINKRNQLIEKKERQGLTPDEEKELERVKKITDVRDLADRIIDTGAGITGQVVVQALGTKGLGAVTQPLATNAMRFATPMFTGVARSPMSLNAGITMSLTSYDPIKQQAVYNFPDNETKQKLYTGAMMGINYLTERIFKDEKIFDAFSRDFRQELLNTLRNASAQGLTRAAIREPLVKSIKKFAGKMGTAMHQNATEEAYAQIGDEILSLGMGAEGYDEKKAIERVGNTYLQSFYGTAPVGALAAMSRKNKADEFNKAGFYKLALDPIATKNLVDDLFNRGEITETEKTERLKILDMAANLVANEPPKIAGKEAKDRAEYLVQNLNAALKTEQLENVTDKNQQAELKKEIEESEKKASEIYNAEMPKVDADVNKETAALELEGKEDAAIKGLQGKDFSQSIVKPYTDVIQSETATTQEKKDALKGLSDQLTARGTEATVGLALGKEADLIYDLGYPIAEESKELSAITNSPITQNVRTQSDFSNESESYRVIVGDEAFNDIVESGVVRTNAGNKNKKGGGIDLTNRPTLFPSFSKGKASMEYAAENPNNYIIVTEDGSIQPSKAGRHGKGTTMFPTDESGNHLKELNGEKVKVYKHLGNGEYELVYENGKVVKQEAKPAVSSENPALSENEKVNRLVFDRESGKPLDGADEAMAEQLIEKAISKSKDTDQANAKLDQLGYNLRGQANADFNQFVQDRIDGKTDMTFSEWKNKNKSKTEAATVSSEGSGVEGDVEATAKKIVGESAFNKLKKEGYTIEKGKFDSDAYASFFGLHTGVQADEFANAGLRLVKPSEKIKVYRGKGKNVAEGENEGVTWVAEDKKVAENYSGDGNVEEVEVSKPKNPFPNPTDTIHVKGSDVGNKLRLVRDRLFKEGKLTKEQALEASKSIDEFVSAAGEESELYSTKTNKKGVSSKYVKALQALGFDGIVQNESYNSGSPFTATKTGNETNTYGIFKAVDQSLSSQPLTEVEGGVGVEGDVKFTAKWGNKVVDEKGEPIELIHATNDADIKFDDGTVLYGTTDSGWADSYGVNQKKMIVSLKKPYEIDGNGKDDFIRDEKGEVIYDGQPTSKSEEGTPYSFRYMDESVVKKLKEMGYDGVVMKTGGFESSDGKQIKEDTHIIAFDKSQIKEQPKVEQSLSSQPLTEVEGGQGSGVGRDVEVTTKALDNIDYVQEGIEDADIRLGTIESLLKKARKEMLDPEADKSWDKNHYQFNLQLLSSLIAEREDYENIKKENAQRDFTEMQGIPPKDENGKFIKNGKEYSEYIDRAVLPNVNKNINNFKNYIAKEYHKAKADGSNPDLVKAVEQSLKEQPASSQPLTEVEGGQTVETTSEVKDGFTEGEDLNKIYAGLKAKYGDKKAATLYEVANRLVNPNKNTIVEIRSNGVVVKEGDKYTLLPFGNTDANHKKWVLYKGLDVTNQFAKPTEKIPENESTQEATKAPQSIKEELDAQKEMGIKNAMRPVLFPIAGREDISKISSEDALDRAKGLREEWNKLKQIIDCIWKMK